MPEFDKVTCYEEDPMGRNILMKLVFRMLRNLAQRTDNKVDDALVDILESAVNSDVLDDLINDIVKTDEFKQLSEEDQTRFLQLTTAQD